ncbi:MAG: aldehyde ferredoxin oxidoreductase C-terminal domain-containing protein [Acidobacteriota bacterium]
MATTGGYRGKLALIDLTNRTVSIEAADASLCRDYVGGRGVQARLILDHIQKVGPIKDPLGPQNRIVIGSAAPNDTMIATAGRGSCSFISPMTRSPEPVAWVPDHQPLYGLITHASCGGRFPNVLKRAGLDHLIIDGRSERPVRLVVAGGRVEIVDAEDALFEDAGGRRTARECSSITEYLTSRYPKSSTVCIGPGGWNQVSFACLTADLHRNFGRGGAGAVFGSKNLVAVTAYGDQPVGFFDADRFQRLSKQLDDMVKSHVGDSSWTASFRPETGTTWWLDRAFNGKYLGKQGGYLPWHNFDEGSFAESDYTRVSTNAFLQISGQHHVCNRCRHIMCTRSAKVDEGPYAGKGVRPEFETIALWINCCITDRDAIFHLNHLCNELGVDTMTLGSVMSGAMELTEKGYLRGYANPPRFGDPDSMIRTLREIAYQSTPLGRLFGSHSDRVIAEVGAANPSASILDIARCVTTSFGGLGYAGIEPKVFPGMFTAYGTSNRGRGDHTYAWTIQAEEGGLQGAENLAAYVASGQRGKALVDSLGLCDFFTEDVTADLFLSLYHALTGFEYTPDSLKECGGRIYAVERHVNNLQGRNRIYDSYVPAKLVEPLTCGAHAGKRVDKALYGAILDAYYREYGWDEHGIVPASRLAEHGVPG